MIILVWLIILIAAVLLFYIIPRATIKSNIAPVLKGAIFGFLASILVLFVDLDFGMNPNGASAEISSFCGRLLHFNDLFSVIIIGIIFGLIAGGGIQLYKKS